jgi:membrane-associated protein
MEILKKLLDVLLHLNTHLDALVGEYGGWVYAILFLIVFCETGLVITPFLPGDSLLFAAGALAADGRLDLFLLMILLIAAAIAGDAVNYWVGSLLGHRLIVRFPRLIKQKHLDRTHEFFERYGGKTIIIARFVPIVRTLAPFVAGIGQMSYPRFALFNLLGAVLWVGLIVPVGFLFANHPFVKQNFSLVILAIIGLSMLPAVIEFWRERRRADSRRRDQATRSSPPSTPLT